MEPRISDDDRRNPRQALADGSNRSERRRIVQRRKFGGVAESAHYRVRRACGFSHLLAAMHDTVSDGVDSYAAMLPQPIYGAHCSHSVISDRRQLLKPMTPFIAHFDTGARSNFFEGTGCKPPGIFCLSRLLSDLDQLKFQR